ARRGGDDGVGDVGAAAVRGRTGAAVAGRRRVAVAAGAGVPAVAGAARGRGLAVAAVLQAAGGGHEGRAESEQGGGLHGLISFTSGWLVDCWSPFGVMGRRGRIPPPSRDVTATRRGDSRGRRTRTPDGPDRTPRRPADWR